MNHELFMRRCFDLARIGAGQVSPNPMVGAVLVHEGKIIGEGWHQRYGEAHAEVNCLRSVRAENQHLIPYSTLYCSLEPCFHFGKTPPCVELILQHRIPHIVIANTDPNPKVAGQSIDKMRESGVTVETDVLSEEGAWLNRIFFHWIRQKSPYIVLKWAESADGYMAAAGERTPISGPITQRLVHQWRSKIDAILVGTSTVLIDNPRLDSRLSTGKNPLRIAYDSSAKIPADYNILDDTTETWILGPERSGGFQQTKFIESGDKMLINNLLQYLYRDNRGSLLVEGGAVVLTQFLEQNHWDEIRLIQSKKQLGAGVASPRLPPGAVLRDMYHIGPDTIRIYSNPARS